MTLPGLLGLVALALVDSTSIGTLIIPLWLLLRPRWRLSLIVVYLGTITAFYLLVGLLLMAGALTVLPAVVAVLATPTTAWIQLGLGVALFALNFWLDPKAVRKRAAKAGRKTETAPRWQQRIDRAAATPSGMITLALSAGLAEVATMVPYLAAIAIIGSFGLSAPASVLTLAGYTLVMVLPALCLVVARLVAGRRVNDALDRLGAWLARHTGSSVSWIVGIIGVLLAWDAVARLNAFGVLPLVSMTLEFWPYELGRAHVDYLDGWDLQRRVHAEVAAGQRPDTVLLLEHASVYTAGKRTETTERPTDGTPVVDVDRGGKITWHGPGQLVGYPIVRLPESVYVVDYVRRLEEAIISLFTGYGLTTGRVPGRSGVWLPADTAGHPSTGSGHERRERKIAAIGIRVAGGVTMHGFAINVDPDLGWFDRIVPCGIADAGVTSLALETDARPTLVEVADRLRPELERFLAFAPYEQSPSLAERPTVTYGLTVGVS